MRFFGCTAVFIAKKQSGQRIISRKRGDGAKQKTLHRLFSVKCFSDNVFLSVSLNENLCFIAIAITACKVYHLFCHYVLLVILGLFYYLHFFASFPNLFLSDLVSRLIIFPYSLDYFIETIFFHGALLDTLEVSLIGTAAHTKGEHLAA